MSLLISSAPAEQQLLIFFLLHVIFKFGEVSSVPIYIVLEPLNVVLEPVYIVLEPLNVVLKFVKFVLKTLNVICVSHQVVCIFIYIIHNYK